MFPWAVRSFYAFGGPAKQSETVSGARASSWAPQQPARASGGGEGEPAARGLSDSALGGSLLAGGAPAPPADAYSLKQQEEREKARKDRVQLMPARCTAAMMASVSPILVSVQTSVGQVVGVGMSATTTGKRYARMKRLTAVH